MSRATPSIRRGRASVSELQNYVILAFICIILVIGFYAFYVPPARDKVDKKPESPKEPAAPLSMEERVKAALAKRAMKEKEIRDAGFGRITGIILSLMNKDAAFTLFAPSEKALEKLGKIFRPENPDPQNLRSICTHLLTFAAVAQAIPLSAMREKKFLRVESLSGTILNLVKGPGKKYSVNGHVLLKSDLAWGKIVVHEIDGVIMPPDFEHEMQFNAESEEDSEPLDPKEDDNEEKEETLEVVDEEGIGTAELAANVSSLLRLDGSAEDGDKDEEDSDARNQAQLVQQDDQKRLKLQDKQFLGDSESEAAKREKAHRNKPQVVRHDADDGETEGKQEDEETSKKGSEKTVERGERKVRGGEEEREKEHTGRRDAGDNLKGEEDSGRVRVETIAELGGMQVCNGHGIPVRTSSGVECDCVVAFIGDHCEVKRDMEDYLLEPYVGPGRHLVLTQARVTRAMEIIAEQRANAPPPPPKIVPNVTARDDNDDDDDDKDEDEREVKRPPITDEDEDKVDESSDAWLARLEPLTATLRPLPSDMPPELISVLPEEDRWKDKVYATCAVVASSGSLLLSQLGSEIDAHDFVIRFNAAPTRGYEKAVGSKTDVRVITHEWLGFKEGNETSILHLWLRNPSEELSKAVRFKREFHKGELLVVDPMFAHHIFITLGTIPSTGFVGIALAMHLCHEVNLFGFMGGEKEDISYHYYDHESLPRPPAELDREMEALLELTDTNIFSFGEPCHFECAKAMADCAACLKVRAEEVERRMEWSPAQVKGNEDRERRWLQFMRWQERERERSLRDLSQTRRASTNDSSSQSLGSTTLTRGNIWSALIEKDKLDELPVMTLLMYFRQHHIAVPLQHEHMIDTVKSHYHFYQRHLENQTARLYHVADW